jgi:hypothetical protein
MKRNRHGTVIFLFLQSRRVLGGACPPPRAGSVASASRCRETPFCGRLLPLLCALLLAGGAFVWGGDTVTPAVSVSLQPYANWLYYSGLLDYRINPSMFTTVDLSLKYKDWLNFAFGFDYKRDDNYVGGIMDNKLFSRLMGQLGINNFGLRASWGRLEGNAEWQGEPVPGQPDSAVVDTEYYEIALLYYFAPWIYLGINYQNYHIPISLNYGYDDDLGLDYYGAYFGMSTFRYFMDNWNESEETFHVGFWLEQNLSLGAALGDVSQEARRRERFGHLVSLDKHPGLDVLPRDSVNSLLFSGNWQIIAGLCGGVQLDRVFLGFGAGYDGFTQFYANMLYASALARHGFVVRAYCSF